MPNSFFAQISFVWRVESIRKLFFRNGLWVVKNSCRRRFRWGSAMLTRRHTPSDVSREKARYLLLIKAVASRAVARARCDAKTQREIARVLGRFAQPAKRWWRAKQPLVNDDEAHLRDGLREITGAIVRSRPSVFQSNDRSAIDFISDDLRSYSKRSENSQFFSHVL